MQFSAIGFVLTSLMLSQVALAQDAKPPVPPGQPPRVIIIETTPAIERSEVIRKVVEALEKDGVAKRSDEDRAGKPIDFHAEIHARPDVVHEKMRTLIETMKSLSIGRVSLVVSSQEGTNRVIISCPADVAWRRVRSIQEELEKLKDFTFDLRVAANNDPVTPTGPALTELREDVQYFTPAPEGSPPIKADADFTVTPAESVADLRQKYSNFEKRTKEQAARLRERLSDPGVARKLKAELQDAVRQAFAARQKLQRAELAEFARRMQGIQQSIEMRDRIESQIIDRRVEELLSPALRWEPTDEGEATPSEVQQQVGEFKPTESSPRSTRDTKQHIYVLNPDASHEHLESVFEQLTKAYPALAANRHAVGSKELISFYAKHEEAAEIFARLKQFDRAPSAAKPTSSPLTALIWIEAVFDYSTSVENQQSKVVYLNGTVVAPDGLIAVFFDPDHDPAKRLKSAKVYLDDGRIVDGRLAAYDAQWGAGLMKVDATDLPFLALAKEPVATDRRLRLYAMRVSTDQQKDRRQDDVRVERAHDGFFTLSASLGMPMPISRDDAGAALVSATGQLEGIVAVPNEPPPSPSPPVWAIPANILERMLRAHEGDERTPKPNPEDGASAWPLFRGDALGRRK